MLTHGFLALSVERGTTEPGRYSPPWGGREGINRHGELTVVEQVKRAEQLAADRDHSFPYRPSGKHSCRLLPAVSMIILIFALLS